MLVKPALFCALVALVASKSSPSVTFKNVLVSGYSMYTYKFNVTIKSSNNLKENLPKQVFDRLDIINSEIPVLYKNSISDLEDLDELIFANNELSDIQPGAFKNVPQLRKLEIRNNKLEEIKAGVFNNLNIATLDLSNNSISTIASGAFDDMPELLNVNLADNRVKIWNKNWFANTPLLARVSFQNNLIEEIPSNAFRHFQGEKQFGSVPLTINIVLSHNLIKHIHNDAFKGLEKINNLWLDGNELSEWDENLLTGVSVHDLRIDNNKLECLDGNLDKVFVAATTHIDGNPWDCGCLKNIDLWASKATQHVVMIYSKMNCDAERIARKLDALDLRLKELRKNNTDVM
ncbi:Protein slit-like Protein [Tribolium castaneum]|uniref:Protein slit-like Protein n=1 Tax=Tribolium castaneum TaxID=7070 RepID=A0A139WNB9_TRICA|nr:Protein slit-like Protein [Tribolium castaneum]